MDSSAIPLSNFVRDVLPFVNGGAAGMFATICIQPIDMIKVRIQLMRNKVHVEKASSLLKVAKNVVSHGKILDLYSGLSAALLRQAVYATARLGLFHKFLGYFQERAKMEGRRIRFTERGAAGVAAGGIAAIIGTPADLALIRMQADSLLPDKKRMHYRGVFDVIRRIVKSEGIGSLWSGAKPTVIRAMAMNFGQLTLFSESKVQLKQRLPGLTESTQVFFASSIAAFFAAVLSLPFDFIKTRLQEQSKVVGGGLRYRGMVDCAKKVTYEEGILRVYRGFGTYYLRVGPQAIITLLLADYLNLITSRDKN